MKIGKFLNAFNPYAGRSQVKSISILAGGSKSLPSFGIGLIETVPAISASADSYANVISSLPKYVRKRGDSTDRQKDHEVTQLLTYPNKDINAQKFYRWVSRRLLIDGTVLVSVDREDTIKGPNTGRIVQLSPARYQGSNKTLLDINDPTTQINLQLPGNKNVVRQYRDVLHITDETFDPFCDQTNTRQYKLVTLGTAWLDVLERYRNRLHNGQWDSAFIQMSDELDQQEAFDSKWKEKVTGIEQAGSLIGIPHGSQVFILKQTDVERQTTQMLEMLAHQIYTVTLLPPFLAGARPVQSGNVRNRSDLQEQFHNWKRIGLGGHINSFTSEMSKKLLPDSEQSQYVIEFNTDRLTMGTMENRVAAAVDACGISPVTPNEARQYILEFPKSNDPEADVLHLKTHMSKADLRGPAESDET